MFCFYTLSSYTIYQIEHICDYRHTLILIHNITSIYLYMTLCICVYNTYNTYQKKTVYLGENVISELYFIMSRIYWVCCICISMFCLYVAYTATLYTKILSL